MALVIVLALTLARKAQHIVQQIKQTSNNKKRLMGIVLVIWAIDDFQLMNSMLFFVSRRFCFVLIFF